MTNKRSSDHINTIATSELRYRRLFETAQDGILLVDFHTGMILDVNKFLIDLLGYSKKDFLKKYLWEAGVFKDIAASKKKFKTLQTKRYVRFEDLPLETKHGALIDVEFVANAYSVGEEIVIQCNIRDITARKKAEHGLKISEVKFRRLFEAAQDSILILDGETGVVNDSNPFIEKLLGYSKKDLVGKHLWQVSPFKTIAANKKSFFELQKKKYVRYEDLPLETKQGDKIYVEFISNVYEVDGKNVVQCNIRDITERVLLSNELKKEKEQIEQQVEDRTKELAQSKAQLQVKQEAYALAVLGTGSVLYDYDLIGGGIMWDGATDELFGNSLKEAQKIDGKGWEKRIHPQDREAVLADFGAAIAKKKNYLLHYPFQRKDGTYSDVVNRGSIFYDKKGTAVRALGLMSDVTKQKEVEEKFKHLFEYAGDAIFIADPQTKRLVDCNRYAEQFTGFSRGKILTMRIRDLHPPALQKEAEQNFKKQFIGTSGPFLTEILTKDKRRIPVSVNASVVKIGGKFFAQGLFRDMTEQYHAQQALRMSEEKYRSIIESSSDQIFMLDEHGTFLSVNTVVTDLFRTNTEKIIGKTISDFFPESIAGELSKNIKKVFATRKPLSVEGKLTIHAHTFYHSTNLSPVKDDKGTVIAVAGIVRDITERYQLESARESLHEAKEKIILSSIGDGVIATDAHGKIIIFNHVASQITGFSANEAIGSHYKDILNLMMEGSGTSCKDFIGQAIKEGKTIAMANHMMLIRKDGSSVPVADSAAPFFDAQQKIGGCVVIFRDVTREREVDRAKTEFVSLASHQLRTPLTSIDWISEMLLNKNFGEITDKQKESIEMLHRSSRRMVSLIGALLNVSRLELGTFVINPTSVKLSRVADETLQELDRQIKQKELTIVRKYPLEESPIRVDAIFIKIIWQNLLTNAVKYAFPKTTLTVSLEKSDRSYLFAVKNVGIGIPQEDQPRIFSKLFRASNAQSMDTDGTGLGLYMAKTILDESGGKIWFDSIVDGETNFFVELPLSGMEGRTGNKSLEIV